MDIDPLAEAELTQKVADRPSKPPDSNFCAMLPKRVLFYSTYTNYLGSFDHLSALCISICRKLSRQVEQFTAVSESSLITGCIAPAVNELSHEFIVKNYEAQ